MGVQKNVKKKLPLLENRPLLSSITFERIMLQRCAWFHRKEHEKSFPMVILTSRFVHSMSAKDVKRDYPPS